jgi:hypothetical protein
VHRPHRRRQNPSSLYYWAPRSNEHRLKTSKHCNREENVSKAARLHEIIIILPLFERHLQWKRKYLHTSVTVVCCAILYFCRSSEKFTKRSRLFLTYVCLLALFWMLWTKFFSSYRNTILHNELRRRMRGGISVLTVSNKTWFPTCSDTKRTA